VKLETGKPCRVARGELKTGNSRSGVALIITLTVMALLLILALAFMTNMRSERQVSFNYRRQVEARQAALAGLHTAIARMSRFYTDAEAANATVATMAGRFYYTNGVDRTLSAADGIPGSYTAYNTNNMLMFSWILGPLIGTGGGTTNWADKVDINAGNYTWPVNAAQSGTYLPVANPCVNPFRPNWGPDKVGIWAAYLLSNANRTGCKFAFWIDDESSKINISNAYTKDLSLSGGGVSNTNIFSDVGAVIPVGRELYAKIVQPDVTLGITKNISSVDLKMLDVGEVCPTSPYNQDGPNWADMTTLSSIESARNSGTWQPFLAPDEVLGLENRVTMKDYQAVKSCLTAWSVEKEDLTQIFRNYTAGNTLGLPVARTNIGMTITTPADAKKLYDFLMTTNRLADSTYVRNFFGNSATFQLKYPGPEGNTNASVKQIVANLISYVSDPTRVAPPGSKLEVVGAVPGSYDPKSNLSIPNGACGLWKAAYMNEIAMALCWQRKVTPGPTPVTQYQLWAALCVELINPYEVPLPRASKPEQYRLFLDTPLTIKCNLAVGSTPGSIGPVGWTTNSPTGDGIAIPSSVPVPAHSYSAPDAASLGVTFFQWPVGPPVTTNAPPTVTSIAINMPQIRQTMDCNGNTGIIDWYRTTNVTLNAQPYTTTTDPPAPADFWTKDAGHPARLSFGKNDPRVHVWTYCASGAVTMKGYGSTTGQNQAYSVSPVGPVDFRMGDIENYHSAYAPNATRPEYRSNFVIAEGGMKSIGELGFIHTGKPWRSLSLQFYGAQRDEQQSGGTPKPWTDSTAIPDWAMLDLFSVNTPPIYGRININNGGWHLGNNTYGPNNYNNTAQPTYPTFEDPQVYPRRPNMLATWSDAGYQLRLNTSDNYHWCYITMRTSSYSAFRYNLATAPTYDAASVPLAAALSVIPDSRFRNKLANYISYRYHPINSQRTQFAPLGDHSDTTFGPNDTWQPYYTIGQLCEVPCMTNLFMGDGTQVAWTDADREDTIRRIINVLTTRGDVFTVHAMGAADGGEARLMAVVERVHDPSLTIPRAYRNRFRILQTRWIKD